MKQILMIQSMGNNESAWARIMSMRGRVVLQVLSDQSWREIWEYGRLVLSTPPRKERRVSTRNIILRDTFTMLRLFAMIADLRRKCGMFDLAIGASTHYGTTALIMRSLGWSRSMVSLLQDYYPVRGSFGSRMWRKCHKAVSQFSARRADEVWRLSSRIPTAEVNPNRYVIPVYIDDFGTGPDNRTDIAYIGGPIEDHCLPWLFDIARRHGIRLHIVCDNPYLATIRHLAPPDTIFHGTVYGRDKLAEIMRQCFCGYAVYRDTSENNFAWYGVPSKIYGYLAGNLPPVTTDICEWSCKVSKHGLGRLVAPGIEEVEDAILDIRSHYKQYFDAIQEFRHNWNNNVEKFLNERMDHLFEHCGL